MTSGSDNLLYVQEEASGGSCGCYRIVVMGARVVGGGSRKVEMGPW